MKKEKILRICAICAFAILMVIKFYITFQKGVVKSASINKNNIDLILIGFLLSICVLIFGTTIFCERKGIRNGVISFGILSIILHLIATLIAVFT